MGRAPRIETTFRGCELPRDPTNWTDKDLIHYVKTHCPPADTQSITPFMEHHRLTPKALWCFQSEPDVLYALSHDETLNNLLLQLAQTVQPAVSPTTPRIRHVRRLSEDFANPPPPPTPPPPSPLAISEPESEEDEEDDDAESIVSDWALDDIPSDIAEEDHTAEEVHAAADPGPAAADGGALGLHVNEETRQHQHAGLSLENLIDLEEEEPAQNNALDDAPDDAAQHAEAGTDGDATEDPPVGELVRADGASSSTSHVPDPTEESPSISTSPAVPHISERSSADAGTGESADPVVRPAPPETLFDEKVDPETSTSIPGTSESSLSKERSEETPEHRTPLRVDTTTFDTTEPETQTPDVFSTQDAYDDASATASTPKPRKDAVSPRDEESSPPLPASPPVSPPGPTEPEAQIHDNTAPEGTPSSASAPHDDEDSRLEHVHSAESQTQNPEFEPSAPKEIGTANQSDSGNKGKASDPSEEETSPSDQGGPQEDETVDAQSQEKQEDCSASAPATSQVAGAAADGSESKVPVDKTRMTLPPSPEPEHLVEEVAPNASSTSTQAPNTHDEYLRRSQDQDQGVAQLTVSSEASRSLGHISGPGESIITRMDGETDVESDGVDLVQPEKIEQGELKTLPPTTIDASEARNEEPDGESETFVKGASAQSSTVQTLDVTTAEQPPSNAGGSSDNASQGGQLASTSVLKTEESVASNALSVPPSLSPAAVECAWQDQFELVDREEVQRSSEGTNASGGELGQGANAGTVIASPASNKPLAPTNVWSMRAVSGNRAQSSPPATRSPTTTAPDMTSSRSSPVPSHLASRSSSKPSLLRTSSSPATRSSSPLADARSSLKVDTTANVLQEQRPTPTHSPASSFVQKLTRGVGAWLPGRPTTPYPPNPDVPSSPRNHLSTTPPPRKAAFVGGPPSTPPCQTQLVTPASTTDLDTQKPLPEVVGSPQAAVDHVESGRPSDTHDVKEIAMSASILEGRPASPTTKSSADPAPGTSGVDESQPPSDPTLSRTDTHSGEDKELVAQKKEAKDVSNTNRGNGGGEGSSDQGEGDGDEEDVAVEIGALSGPFVNMQRKKKHRQVEVLQVSEPPSEAEVDTTKSRRKKRSRQTSQRSDALASPSTPNSAGNAFGNASEEPDFSFTPVVNKKDQRAATKAAKKKAQAQ